MTVHKNGVHQRGRSTLLSQKRLIPQSNTETEWQISNLIGCHSGLLKEREGVTTYRFSKTLALIFIFILFVYLVSGSKQRLLSMK
jgi:hypothetical protein